MVDFINQYLPLLPWKWDTVVLLGFWSENINMCMWVLLGIINVEKSQCEEQGRWEFASCILCNWRHSPFHPLRSSLPLWALGWRTLLSGFSPDWNLALLQHHYVAAKSWKETCSHLNLPAQTVQAGWQHSEFVLAVCVWSVAWHASAHLGMHMGRGPLRLSWESEVPQWCTSVGLHGGHRSGPFTVLPNDSKRVPGPILCFPLGRKPSELTGQPEI